MLIWWNIFVLKLIGLRENLLEILRRFRNYCMIRRVIILRKFERFKRSERFCVMYVCGKIVYKVF